MPKRNDISSILIIGAGPIVIGQACEFDYSGTQACKALKEEGYRVILINSNPATIMTDPEIADSTYVEPINTETVEKIIKKEKPCAILPTMGGQTALNIAKNYIKERKAFGKRLSDFQGLQFKVADMEIAINSSRIFLREAAWKLDNEKSDASVYCAMAKKYVTDNAFNIANNSLQLLGGYGYLTDYGIEKIVRDLRVHQILEGTNEIMQLIIARNSLK